MGNKTKLSSGIREKGRPTIKKKSIKSRALDINSKRRARKAGNVRKKGHEGHAIRYITRRRAMRKLQLNLQDFRRLCILKGIYPREPEGKKVNQTCFHVKDIAFLAHEPLLNKFAEIKAYMDKVAHLINRKNVDDARRKYDARPEYTLDHLIKERYPRFRDSLADMDDALCLLHLFANMRHVSKIDAARSANCLRLCREWQLYVVRSRSLRKTFVSVKGIYYQAEVFGELITWIVPHKFAQQAPKEVDFRVMSTFLEFYESLTSFVLFKLYHTLGLRYPPKLDASRDETGAHLDSIQTERIADDNEEVEDEDDVAVDDVEATTEAAKAETKASAGETRKLRAKADAESKARIATLSQRMREIAQHDDEEEEEKDADERAGEGQDPDLDDEAFAGDEQAQQIAEQERETQARTNLLRGLSFFLSREVPFEPLEFIIRAFGGQVLSASAGDKATDKSITHFVTDRPKIQRANTQCEYVQPQWVFDSVNWKVLLPVQKYAPDAPLPPHLSPFVDNTAVGYKPEYAEEIERLQAAAGVSADKLAPPSLLRDTYQASAEDVEDAEASAARGGAQADDEDDEDAEEAFVEELQEELRTGQRRKRKRETAKDKAAAEESEIDATDKGESTAADVLAHAESESESEGDDQDAAANPEPAPKKLKKASTKKSAQESTRDTETEVKTQEPLEDEAAAKAAKTKAKKSAKKQQKDDDEEADAATTPKKPEALTFVKAKKFAGPRPGLFFKLGPQGLGYYPDTNANRKPTFRSGKVVSKRQQRLAQKKEESDRAHMLMSGKSRRLYGQMQHGIKAKQANAAELRRRRRK